ncbi:LamG domain-containing protein [Acidovorax radicis]|uniref:LamG domain-containing protein n=1 Tax=Acidovorax radicis TaxID=758826 RepID=UPI001CFA2B1C|nr:LamG domain-containing protein [Acidovorax radicis]UCV01148.1 LamG domain-containing protein [Acidovorax radicis]
MAGDADFSKVVLLLKGDGANNSTTVVDSSSFGKTISVGGNAKISTTQSKFGGASLRADGSASTRFFSGADADFDLGSITSSSNYTIELWVRLDGVGGEAQNLISHALPGSGGSGRGGWSLYSTSGNLALQISGISSATNPWIFGMTTTTAVLSAATWAHVAIVLQNGVPKIYVNGVAATTTVTSGAIWATTPIGLNSTKTDYGVSIGATGTDSNNPSPLQLLSGYIDEVRITKGLARYTANFTPPTAGFPTFGADAELSASAAVGVTSSSSASVSNSGAAAANVSVASTAAGGIAVDGSAATTVAVTSAAAGELGIPEAVLSGAATVGVSSTASGAAIVQGAGSTAINVTSSADATVRSGAELSGSTVVDVASAGSAAVRAAGQGASEVTVLSVASGSVPVRGQASASVAVSSAAAGAVPIAAFSDNTVQVGSVAAGAVAVTGQAAAVVNITSATRIRGGTRDFTRDVSVATMLREISARTAPLSVVAISAPGQVTVTTRQREISVLA